MTEFVFGGITITKMGSTKFVREPTGERTMNETDSSEHEPTADDMLEQAIKAALETERPKHVAQWLRGAAERVEDGDFDD